MGFGLSGFQEEFPVVSGSQGFMRDFRRAGWFGCQGGFRLLGWASGCQGFHVVLRVSGCQRISCCQVQGVTVATVYRGLQCKCSGDVKRVSVFQVGCQVARLGLRLLGGYIQKLS